jgi:deoxyadenosine/deoxycytidine kinase
MNHKESNIFRIEICGGIAAGKTTLANLLGQSGFDPILENFQANPFLRTFYSDPRTYAFETEITFLLQHYNQIKASRNKFKKAICDFSSYLDFAYSSVTLPSDKFYAFQCVYGEVRRDISTPSFLVYLQCSATTQLQRIRYRNRSFEQSIDLEFLENINESLIRRIEEAYSETKLIEIDSERLDFANDIIVQQKVIKLIQGLVDEAQFNNNQSETIELTQ